MQEHWTAGLSQSPSVVQKLSGFQRALTSAANGSIFKRSGRSSASPPQCRRCFSPPLPVMR